MSAWRGLAGFDGRASIRTWLYRIATNRCLPLALEYEGRDAVARFCAAMFGAGRTFDFVPTRANGQPALGAYLRAPAGVRHGTGLFVLTLAGDRIRAVTRFENSVLPSFGLPRSLPPSPADTVMSV